MGSENKINNHDKEVVVKGRGDSDEVLPIRVPMQCVIESRGFRMTAMPMLQLTKQVVTPGLFG